MRLDVDFLKITGLIANLHILDVKGDNMEPN